MFRTSEPGGSHTRWKPYCELCISASDEIEQVAALVGRLGSRVRAGWCADEVEAQRAQHEPRRPLLRALLQQLPVHAALLRGRASAFSSHAAGGCMRELQLLCAGRSAEHQAQARQQQRLHQLLELGVVTCTEDLCKCPLDIPLPTSHRRWIDERQQP